MPGWRQRPQRRIIDFPRMAETKFQQQYWAKQRDNAQKEANARRVKHRQQLQEQKQNEAEEKEGLEALET